MAEEYRSDGWTNFAGGMRMADGARGAVQSDQAEILTNVTVRNGRAEPRPAWHLRPIAWHSLEAQNAFERGAIQASRYYDGPNGARWIYIADGHILSFDPVEGLMRTVSPEGDRPFHRLAQHCFLEQRGRWMVCQDGISPAVILDGDNAEINADPFNGVPTGMMMADGWHRLCIVAPDRSRIYISDHEFDPISTPLSFTDDATYYKNARFFRVPRSLGLIVGIAFAPSFNNQDDWGPLLVFCEHGTRAYQLQVPRENWLDQDIAATLLPTVGGCAHGAITARGNDVLFSDHNGRIQTFKQAISTRDDVRLRPADQAVYPLYRGEDSRYRRWRKSARFDDRILTTVWPEPVPMGGGRLGVRHRGFVVLEEDHLSSRPFVWSGLWTGIYPVAIDSGGVTPEPGQSPVERCFCVSNDPDRVNRIYELTRTQGPDMVPEPRRVPMWVIPRWLDYEAAFKLKRMEGQAIQLSDLRGRVDVRGWWQTGGHEPRHWFVHNDAVPDCLLFGVGKDCAVLTPGAVSRPRLNIPGKSDEFYRARPWLRVLGQAAIEEGIFQAAINSAPPQAKVKCGTVETAIAKDSPCVPNFWEKHARETGEAEPPLPVSVCQNSS